MTVLDYVEQDTTRTEHGKVVITEIIFDTTPTPAASPDTRASPDTVRDNPEPAPTRTPPTASVVSSIEAQPRRRRQYKRCTANAWGRARVVRHDCLFLRRPKHLHCIWIPLAFGIPCFPNPRRCDPQRFSRPPQSTTLPSLLWFAGAKVVIFFIRCK